MKFFLALLALGFFFTSCSKEDRFTTSSTAVVLTSVDTVKFDTVLVNSGSVTKLFKIVNINNKKLNLSSVRLMGGTASMFRMNVDGLPGFSFTNLEIAANDSVYVYVTVNASANASTLPYVVRDSVQLQYNGNTKYVQLQAYGQNAVFLNNVTLNTNTVWNNTLPYVILGQLTVAKNVTLTVNKGTKIFSHANAPIYINGSLVVNGDKLANERVVFKSDRLDAPYNEYAGGWPGIYFAPSSQNNVLRYAEIRNAYQALIVDSAAPNGTTKLQLHQTIVDNSYDIGLLSIGGTVAATNCLISNCGKNIAISYGGTYSFNHCTVASYSNSNITHKDPVLIATNYIKEGQNTYYVNGLNAQFSNCIFWGDYGTVEDEVLVDRQTSAPFTVQFNKCIYKVKTTLSTIVTNTAGLANAAPEFDSISTSRNYYDFRLKDVSPARNAGVASSVTIDLDGKARPVGLPDIGAYEKQ